MENLQKNTQQDSSINHPKAFAIGSRVEVTSKSDGFRNTWFQGEIITPPEDPPEMEEDGNFWVQFDSLVVKDDDTKPYRDCIPASLMRPQPPKSVYWASKKVFEVNDSVEALHEEGWWVGVVKEVVGDGKKYLVAIGDGREITFPKRRLRVHLEWVDGKWINPATKEEVVIRVVRQNKSPSQLKRKNDNNEEDDSNCKEKKHRGRPSKKDAQDDVNSLKEESIGPLSSSAIERGKASEEIHGDKNKRRGRPLQKTHQNQKLIKEGEEQAKNGSSWSAMGTEEKYGNKSSTTQKRRGRPPKKSLNADDHKLLETGKEQARDGNICTEEEGNEDGTASEAVQSEAALSSADGESTDNIPTDLFWPFSKTSLMWKTIDSIEMYKTKSKMPHFAPLLQQEAHLREKHAIDMMIRFAYETERIRKSHPFELLEDPRTITDILGCLGDLESNGFDTTTLQEYLKRLATVEVGSEDYLRWKLGKVEIEIKQRLEEREVAEIEMSLLRGELKSVEGRIESAKLAIDIKEEELAKLELQKQDIVDRRGRNHQGAAT